MVSKKLYMKIETPNHNLALKIYRKYDSPNIPDKFATIAKQKGGDKATIYVVTVYQLIHAEN